MLREVDSLNSSKDAVKVGHSKSVQSIRIILCHELGFPLGPDP